MPLIPVHSQDCVVPSGPTGVAHRGAEFLQVAYIMLHTTVVSEQYHMLKHWHIIPRRDP